MMTTLSPLPNEMLLRILFFLPSSLDTTYVCPVSRHIAGAAQEALYSYVELRRNPLALTLLVRTLLERPDMAKIVKTPHFNVTEP
jgi:hypothetical protein